jgi:hypothetical protein
MNVRPFLTIGLLVGTASVVAAHDLFVKLESYFVQPGAAVQAPVLNGTFSRSENVIARTRIADLSLVTPAGHTHPDTSALTARGDTTLLALRAGGAGTYVIGLATRPSQIALSGKEFTGYLKDEAIHDVLTARRRSGSAADSAREHYAKFAKAIFQVGDVRTDDFGAVLGYEAEIVPLNNPYALGRGGMLRVRCLVNGAPAAHLSVLAGGRRRDGSRIPQRELRTDAAGVATVRLDVPGQWFLKFIRMTPVEGAAEYQSRWATLTFEVR